MNAKDNLELRVKVVAEALSWVGTPYEHAQCVKGAGVDCALILREVYCSLGIAPWFDPRPYAAQWFLHKDEEVYLGWMAKYAHRITEEEAQPADIVVYKFGRCAAHGAILVNDNSMVHAYLPAGRVQLRKHGPLVRAEIHSYWSPF